MTPGVVEDDPLFLYFFRAFLGLYKQLALLKPILVQERLAHDPWKLLIAVTLLNKTSGRLAIPILWKILDRWPDPFALSRADPDELKMFIWVLGTQNIRSRRLINISKMYLRDPPNLFDPRASRTRYPATAISHLPGTGPYALDSYRIFCTIHHKSLSHEWKSVRPADKELIRFLKWKWAFFERQEWAPSRGVVRPVTASYLQNLINELQRENARPAKGSSTSIV